MRRAIPVIASTAGGLALLANFHTTPTAANVATGPDPGSATTAPASQPRTTLPSARGATTTTAPSTGSRTVDGPVVSTEYGDVQVRVVLDGSKIVDVQALQLPNDRSRSARISEQAGPMLRQEALRAQTARINLISGATYTSEGYVRSLQAALNQAG